MRGILFLLFAEFCFAAATVFGKMVTGTTGISGVEVSFFRFFLGFFLVLFYVAVKDRSAFVPVKFPVILLRALFNTVGVIFFFLAVQYTTITNANMLNLTYPVFVFLVAPFVNRDRTRPVLLPVLLLAMAGIYLVINPRFDHVNLGDIFGLLSGISSAFAVTTLKEARCCNGTKTIVLYVMFIGMIINGLAMAPGFKPLHGTKLLYTIISALLGVTGQVFITAGYFYVNSKSGSIISTARIVYAAVMGAVVFHEVLNGRIIAGGVLVIVSVILATLLGTAEKRSAVVSTVSR